MDGNIETEQSELEEKANLTEGDEVKIESEPVENLKIPDSEIINKIIDSNSETPASNQKKDTGISSKFSMHSE